MPVLGADALGKQALGQISTVPAQTPQTSFSFGYNFSQPRYTPRPPQEGAIDFRILRPDAATPGPLVFTRFSEPYFPNKTSIDKHTSPVFRILRPDAATTGPLVFTRFSEPSFSQVRQQSNTNSSFFVAPAVKPAFSAFSLPAFKQIPQSGFTNAPIALPTQNYVFSKFSEPSKVTSKNSDVVNAPVVTTVAATVVTGGAFSTFSQPTPAKVPQADRLFLGSLGPAATPTWSTFPQFKELLTKKPQQDPSIGFIGDLGPAQTPSRLSFAKFEGIPSRRPLEGYITSTTPPVAQNYVFSKFDQPVYKRILQQDQSFVNFPVVAVAAVQPYLFSDFGQPQQTKRPIIDDRSFLNFPIVVAQQQPYVFSDFGQPQYKAVLKEGQITFNGSLGLAIVPPWFVFGKFDQPQLIKPRVDGFTNTPVFVLTQPYVFTSFEQPRQSKLIVPGFTNNQTFIVPQSYVFSPFEQPIARRALQIDSVQFVGNTPVIVLTPDFSYSDFGIPFYSKQNGISFTNAPLLPQAAVDNSAPFAGFTSFVLQLPAPYNIQQHPGVAYEILVPAVLVEDVIVAGKWWKSKARDIPAIVPVTSSTIDEVVYDKDSNQLNVKFQSGRVYNYNNIDNKKVKGLLRAKSSGKYLHNNIKGKYLTTRMK